MIRVLFVCLGNICRSPMAEGIFRHLVAQDGLSDRFEIDSAGTSGWHAGEKPDHRMRQTAKKHGLSLEDQRSRQFEVSDFEAFNYILAMDSSNLSNIRQLQSQPAHQQAKVELMRNYDLLESNPNVPDPYYGGQNGFEEVYEILLRSNRELLDQLKKHHAL